MKTEPIVIERTLNASIDSVWQALTDNQPGMSYVTFELSEEGEKTRLKLTHEGLESFPADRDSAFAKDNFIKGWNMIIGTLLKEYLEKE